MWKMWILIGAVLLLVVSCSPEVAPESAADDPNNDLVTEDKPLSTVEPAEEESDMQNIESSSEKQPESVEPESQQSEAVTDQVDSVEYDVAEPVSVDLSEITPVPDSGEGELVELPAPGVPKPEVKMVHLVSQDLAERLGLDISEIQLIEVEEIDWPDAGLGCPDPEMGYAAVVTPGYRIVLLAAEETYVYHTDKNENKVHCDNDLPVGSSPG